MRLFSAKKFIEEKEHLKLFKENKETLLSSVQYDGKEVTDISRMNGLYLIEIDYDDTLISKIDCSVNTREWQPYKGGD